MIKYWDQIIAVFKKVWNTIGPIGKMLAAVFCPFIAIPLLVIDNWSAILDFFKGLISSIKGFFQPFIDWILSKIDSILGPIKAVGKWLGFGGSSSEEQTKPSQQKSESPPIERKIQTIAPRVGKVAPSTEDIKPLQQKSESPPVRSGKVVPSTSGQTNSRQP